MSTTVNIQASNIPVQNHMHMTSHLLNEQRSSIWLFACSRLMINFVIYAPNPIASLNYD